MLNLTNKYIVCIINLLKYKLPNKISTHDFNKWLYTCTNELIYTNSEYNFTDYDDAEIFANMIFRGSTNNAIAIYSIKDKKWVKELMPIEEI